MLRLMVVFGFLAFFGANAQCIEVDQYPISDSIIKSVDIPLKIDSVIAYDQAWFKSSNGSEALVIELATDGHRFVTTHFLVDSIEPKDLILTFGTYPVFTNVESNNSEIIHHYISRFTKKAAQIPDSCFTSIEGHKLGESIRLAIEKYGEPDTISKKGLFKVYYWKFEGDLINEGLQTKCAINSFGYEMTFIYLNGKLVARILIDDIP